ncbi:MAG: sensor histidine kinase [Provencibacterium sp.]|nr:sensor histidine kinase [Provencibacterium sp.]
MTPRTLPSRRGLFLQKFSSIFLPMLLVAFLLSAVSGALLIHREIESAIRQSNNMLAQAMQTIEILFGSVDTVALAVCQDTGSFDRIQEIFNGENYDDREARLETERFRRFVSSTANSIPYIQSVYVYVKNDYERFIATDVSQIVSLEEYFDTAWYESYLQHRESDQVWTESRFIQRYSFEKPTEIISRCRMLVPRGMREMGVIVENVEKRKIRALLDSLRLLPGQEISILDDRGQTLLTYRQNGEKSTQESLCMRAEISSRRFGWTFVSKIPYAMLFQAIMPLLQIQLIVLAVCFVLSLGMALIVTRHKYARALMVIRVINSRSPEGFVYSEKRPDEYDYFLESILREYIEKTNLELTIASQQYQLRIMEILALQSQINPHFLFNTLEVIKWESIGLTHGENTVSEMLESLADIMRYSLSDPHEMVSLQKEMEVSKSYIQILQNRYVNKFDVDWRVDPVLSSQQVPKLLLQPLIENSVYHGIKEKPGFCRIRIRIHQRGSVLILRVYNNGAGMTRERLHQVRESLHASDMTNRIGLYNIAKRLSLLFSGATEVRIYSRETLGTTVVIRIGQTQEKEDKD